MRTNIVLVGFMGSGKSSIGRIVAGRLGFLFVDTDLVISQRAGMEISQIFAREGEDGFRARETEAIESLGDLNRCVIATGGGIVTSPDTFALLKAQTITVWLRADANDHWNRVLQQGDRRPMKGHPQAMAELRRLLTTRRRLYGTARHTVLTSAHTPDQVVDEILGVTGSVPTHS